MSDQTLSPAPAALEAVPLVDAPLDDVILRAESITKVFPGTVALDNVTYNVYRGKVNALVGENGAGKSTLMKILAGVEQQTVGRLVLNGNEIRIRSPQEAGRHGIGIIYQQLNLFPNLNVSDNIHMAREILQGGLTINDKAQKQNTRDLIRRLEHRVDPNALIGDLRIGTQQIVEIAKALAQDVRILIMDEPTSALSATEVEVLFKVIRDLKANGVSIIYISHKLEEVLHIADYITVLRDGKLVAEQPCKSIDIPWIIETMVGRNPAAFFHKEEHKTGETLLQVEDMSLPSLSGFTVNHVSFGLRSGEILGLYGLMGAGRSELLECLAGLHPTATGKVILEGRELKCNTVIDRINDGIVLVPENRQKDGLVQTLSVADNMILASLKKLLRWIYLAAKKEKEAVAGRIKDLSIRTSSPQQMITALSGGNQQKVVLAKALMTTPKVLLLDEPTRGIDVGAKSEIFEIMSRLARQGFSILFVSSELKEVMMMTDRILVLSKGSITGEFSSAEATEEALVAASAVGHGIHVNGSTPEEGIHA